MSGLEKEQTADGSSRRSRLREVAAVFLRLGFTAFGGPAAHIGLMEEQVVARRKWIDRAQLLDMIAAVNFIPGPNSTELAMHLGWVRAGWRGLIVAGACFIIPAMLLILPLGFAYVTWGSGVIRGADPPPLAAIRACIVAVVAGATWRFATTAIVDRFTLTIAASSAVAAFVLPRLGVPQAELIILAAAAIAGIAGRCPVLPADRSSCPPLPLAGEGRGEGPSSGAQCLPLMAALPATAPAVGIVAFSSGSIPAMVLLFLKIGATLFGTGYVLVSYLSSGLVHEHGWMTGAQVLDAVAVGQFTPGPLLTSATFVGYLLGHQAGGMPLAILCAVLATVAIFFPSFCFVVALGPLWSRFRASAVARGILRSMNAAVVALVLVASVTLGQQAITNIPTGLVAAASLAVLLIWNINSTWLILAAAAGGAGVMLAG